MKKGLLLVIVAVAMIIAGGVFVFSRQANAPDSQSAKKTQTETDTAAENLPTLTADEVTRHNTKEDCWTIINNSVYNLTEFIARHPGGDEILKACGTNATNLFNGLAEGGRDGGHSTVAQGQLTELKLGDLKN